MEAEIFRELGFTERETKVYIALLELGETTVGPIATKTQLQHSKVYETLDKLIEKGLVSYIVISKTKHFKASDPKEILNILEDRKRRFNEVLEDLEKNKNILIQNKSQLFMKDLKLSRHCLIELSMNSKRKISIGLLLLKMNIIPKMLLYF